MRLSRTACLLGVSWFAAAGQDSTFILSTEALTPYTRTYLGNGYFSVSSSQWGTQSAQSFMI